MYTISLQKRKPGLDKDQGLLTLHDFTPPIILYVQLRVYKLPLTIKLRALLKAWSPREVTYELIEAIGKGAGEEVSDEVKEQCVIMTKY